jgi:hypothetical protein
MKRDSVSDDPNILEAVDNLSSMVDMNVEELKMEKQRDPSEGLEVGLTRWFDPKSEEKTYASVKNTFKTVHKYLQHIYSKEKPALKDVEMQKGIQSILALAREAAAKVDRCSSIFSDLKKRESITESKEFKDLEEFYEKKLLKRFQEVLESEQAWKEEWGKEGDALDLERKGLKNLETVTRDRDYELFYITREDGSKFYNKNLVRHIRLVANFDQLIGEMIGEDPLVKVRVVLDKEAMLSAAIIKKESFSQINSWLKSAKHHKEAPLVRDLHNTLMALLLASNTRNLIGQTTGKNCLGYFIDFQIYLREIVTHVDYKAIIDNPPEDKDHFFYRMTRLIHTLCFYYLIHQIDHTASYSFFAKIIENHRKNSLEEKSHSNPTSFWNKLLDDHESLYLELKQFPSGPLFKVLDILNDQEASLTFDPYTAQARPFIIYYLHYNQIKAPFLRFPCPTEQKIINKASLLEEFSGCLRHLQDRQQKEKIFLINFQDRTSSQEFARCKVLEDLQINAEFNENIQYLNLPKNTDFYLQSDIYIGNNNAKDFKKVFLEQIISGQECGFSFPFAVSPENIKIFATKVISIIHDHFFAGKELLSRKQRLDFIEIFYQLFILKIIDDLGPDFIGFVCKDGIDISSVGTAGFYAFVKMISKNNEWKEEERDAFYVMIFTPALLLRERAPDIQRLSRTVSMLSVITAALEVEKTALLKIFEELYSDKFFSRLSVSQK